MSYRLVVAASLVLLPGCARVVPFPVMKEKSDAPVMLCKETPRAEVDALLGGGTDTGPGKAQYNFTSADGTARTVMVRYEEGLLQEVTPAVEWRRAEDLGASPMGGSKGEDGRPLWVEARLPWLSACKFLGEHSASAELKADAFGKLVDGSRKLGSNFFVVLPSDPHAYPPRYHAANYVCGEVKPSECVSGPLVRNQ